MVELCEDLDTPVQKRVEVNEILKPKMFNMKESNLPIPDMFSIKENSDLPSPPHSATLKPHNSLIKDKKVLSTIMSESSQ